MPPPSDVHPRALAARLCGDPALAERVTGVSRAEIVGMAAVKQSRALRGIVIDPLIEARRTRPYRRPSVLAGAATRHGARYDDAVERAAREAIEQERIRQSLMVAGRVARRLGCDVQAHADRHGWVEGYVCRRGDAIFGITMQGPSTHGGRWLVIDRPRSQTWLRRAVRLLAAGRSVPGQPDVS